MVLSLPNNKVWDLAHVVSRFNKKRNARLKLENEAFQFANRDKPLTRRYWFGELGKKYPKVSQVVIFFSKPVKRERIINGLDRGLNQEFKEYPSQKTKG